MSDDESIALAGAAAIQRLVADRNSLRNCISAQQQDLIALTAANHELLDHLRSFHRLYLEFGARILAQLKQFDQIACEAAQSTGAAASTAQDDANLVALARRLRPDNGTGNSTNGAVS